MKHCDDPWIVLRFKIAWGAKLPTSALKVACVFSTDTKMCTIDKFFKNLSKCKERKKEHKFSANTTAKQVQVQSATYSAIIAC